MGGAVDAAAHYHRARVQNQWLSSHCIQYAVWGQIQPSGAGSGGKIQLGKNGGKLGLGPVFWETELGDLWGLLEGWVQGWVG